MKGVSKWAAAYYTHPASYYKLPSTSAMTLPKISVPKPYKSYKSLQGMKKPQCDRALKSMASQ